MTNNVMDPRRQYTEAFNRLLNEASPEIHAVFAKIDEWLAAEAMDCLDTKLAYQELFSYYVDLQWQIKWQDCIAAKEQAT
jgi:hypothetical protein